MSSLLRPRLHADSAATTPPSCLISITGAPGLGKSTLAGALADACGLQQSLEVVTPESNPYLARFYASPEGMKANVLPLQLTFLAQKQRDLRTIRTQGGGWVQDQLLACDQHVFAQGHAESGLMTPEDWHLYSTVASEFADAPHARPPELVIALTAPLDVMLHRIALRNRAAEQETPLRYWAALHDRYATWVRRYRAAPTMLVDVTSYDLAQDPTSIAPIIARVQEALATSGLAPTPTTPSPTQTGPRRMVADGLGVPTPLGRARPRVI